MTVSSLRNSRPPEFQVDEHGVFWRELSNCPDDDLQAPTSKHAVGVVMSAEAKAEIEALVAQGLTTRQIALQTGWSYAHTSGVARAYKRSQTTSRFGLI